MQSNSLSTPQTTTPDDIRVRESVPNSSSLATSRESVGTQLIGTTETIDETMSSVDPGILCFQHCNPKSKVFCLELPDYCPQCDSPMSCIELKIPPFCVPFPFICAKRTQCSVIIRPTDGDFLHHYQNAADLHIGLTDSKGDVYEFDKYGLQSANRSSSWNH
ncbi:unnamed protein product [Medioppia subpectinata]|uniref:Uncharacterized protein n=1 Tax=Medioppia subpectinata TaxID=1979941 RepID=A0A7R9L191_9ACAR|nr:unnamed protein product [Medioppia subpectinata]CAG2113395.1 unnamed protein product [Medioppia subpectinata]